MTDLKTYCLMLANSDEEFIKRKSGDAWVVELRQREVTIHFNKDESYWFTSNDRRSQ